MFHKPRFTAAALALSTAIAGPLAAQDSDLSGTLTIFSDMSNPAPRAVMEGMVERFGESLSVPAGVAVACKREVVVLTAQEEGNDAADGGGTIEQGRRAAQHLDPVGG